MQLIYEIFHFIVQVLCEVYNFINLFYFPKHSIRNNPVGSFSVMVND